MPETPTSIPPERARRLGRYAIFDAIASGGMATVHLGRLVGPVGFARTVAIKRLHAHLASDPDFRSMFVDEARLAARIRHPNVVPTLDVVAQEGELFLVMEYVPGDSLAHLLGRARDEREPVPSPIVSAIMTGVLHGLHAAHEARSERGEPLDIVHRDVSPQNIIVGTDGVSRVLDFGVAKAIGRLHLTQRGEIKGKLAYMAPEQLRSQTVTRQSDIYAAGVVLWEMLAGRRLFPSSNEPDVIEQVLVGLVDPPSKYRRDVSEALDALVLRALEAAPAQRFTTAREMAVALEKCAPPSLASEVSAWLEDAAGGVLAERAARIAAVEIADVDDVTQLTPARARARRRFSGITVAVTITLTAAATAMVVRGDPRAPSELAAAVTPATASASVAPASASVTSASPPASALGVASATSSAEPSPRHRASASPPRHPSAAVEDCRIPYTVDATGRKIYKRSCL